MIACSGNIIITRIIFPGDATSLFQINIDHTVAVISDDYLVSLFINALFFKFLDGYININYPHVFLLHTIPSRLAVS